MSKHALCLAVLLGCTIGIVNCGDDPDSTGNLGPNAQEVKLQSNEAGELAYCDAAGNCQSLPNPRACATLTVTIDTATGKSCEVCTDANNDVIAESCGGGGTVACQVVTIPEPDCVVCAYVNGAVIFSTCDADDDGPVCDAVACPAIAPYCPDGTEPQRDPNDCCGWVCEPKHCEAVDCPLLRCAEGWVTSYDGPDCCGTCVPATCFSSNDCPSGFSCSTEWGDCGCNAPAGAQCTTLACIGTCVAKPVICPEYMQPLLSECDGTWISAGVDADGCSRGFICVCPDNSSSGNGDCVQE